MVEPLLIFIAAAFLLAGFIKGVIGLGLPTVSMGLLAVTMPRARSAGVSEPTRFNPPRTLNAQVGL